MAKIGWTLGIGDISLTLTGPTDWVEPLSDAWAVWVHEVPGWEVRLVKDESLPLPNAPYYTARPRFVESGCLLQAQGFVGEIVPDEGRAVLKAHPAAELGDLAYFARSAFALRAFEKGALLFHAAGIVHHGTAYAFFGHSGSGKTTAARLSKGKSVLNDDLILLAPVTTGYKVWATPFGKRRDPEVLSASLRALLRLQQAPQDSLESMPWARALGELVANSPVVNADPARASRLLAQWEEVMSSVPVLRLRFDRSDAFWEAIDAYFG
jgi:hypothetical protein